MFKYEIITTSFTNIVKRCKIHRDMQYSEVLTGTSMKRDNHRVERENGSIQENFTNENGKEQYTKLRIKKKFSKNIRNLFHGSIIGEL